MQKWLGFRGNSRGLSPAFYRIENILLWHQQTKVDACMALLLTPNEMFGRLGGGLGNLRKCVLP
jgi:hypothetical protein